MTKTIALFVVIAAAVFAGILGVRYFDQFGASRTQRAEAERLESALRAHMAGDFLRSLNCEIAPAAVVDMGERWDGQDGGQLRQALEIAWNVCQARGHPRTTLMVRVPDGRRYGTWSPGRGYVGDR